MRGIKPPVLFELHAENGEMPWTCATGFEVSKMDKSSDAILQVPEDESEV